MKITSEYIIKISTQSDIAVCHAANELRRYIAQISSIDLPIKTDNNNYIKEIIVGNCRGNIVEEQVVESLTNDGIVCYVVGNKCQLTSNTSRGVLYSVYDFLERVLGCRFFAASDFFVPQLASIEIKDQKYTYSCPLEARDFCDNSCHEPDFGVANKLNGEYYNLQPKHGGKYDIYKFAHTLPLIFDPEVYFATHPEYYALIKGVRTKSPSQMCFTNPELVAIAVDKICEWKRESPRTRIFTISQADGYHLCTCDDCKSVYAKHNSYSSTMMIFLNQVAKALAKEYPDIIIDTLAYLHTRRPPSNLVIESNIQIRLCSIECCHMHALGECDYLSVRHFEYDKSYLPTEYVSDLEQWSRLTRRLKVWDYPCSTVHALLPVPNFDVIQENIRLQLKYGVNGIFLNASYLPEHSSYSDLRGYLYAKCMWDANCNIKHHYIEFMNYYYGSASILMQSAIKYMQDRAERIPLHSVFTSHIDNKYYSLDFAQEYDKILESAEEVTDNEKIKTRIRRERLVKPLLELVYLNSNSADFARKLDDFINKSNNLGITVFREATPEMCEEMYRHILTQKDWYFDQFEEFSRKFYISKADKLAGKL